MTRASPLALFVVVIASFFTNTTTIMAFSGPIGLNVKVNIKPERRQDFLTIIQKDAEQTLATEPGALQFTIGEDVVTPNVFHFHEQYKTMADFEFHQATPHFKEWIDFQATNPFVEDVVASIYQCNHDPTVIPVRTAYCLNVQLCINPAVREEFMEVILNNQDGSRNKEPLCLQYDFGEDVDNPNVFHFHEQYAEDEAGFNAHAVAPHFVKWEEFVAKDDVFTELPVVSFLRTLPLE